MKFSFGGGGGGGDPLGGMGGMGGEPESQGPTAPASSQLHTISINKPQAGGMGFKVDGSNTITGLTAVHMQRLYAPCARCSLRSLLFAPSDCSRVLCCCLHALSIL